MDWKPAFAIHVDGQDITAPMAARLVSLSLSDEAGVTSDSVEITLADHIGLARLAVPRTGAVLSVALGYGFALKDMGLYTVEEVEMEGPPNQMRIRGAALITGGVTSLTAQRSRSWPEGTTIADLVATIAGEHGLDPAVSDSLARVALPHLDQIDESDINLLTRVAHDHDAIAKPGGGKLVFALRGESLTVSGQPMPVVALTPAQVSSWRVQIKTRATAGTVVAVWRDQQAAGDVEETAGEGEPLRRLRERFASAEAARAAARAEWTRASRAGTQLSLSLPGNADLVAEGRVQLTGFRPGVDGNWLVTGVEHQLDSGGYRCRLRAEVGED